MVTPGQCLVIVLDISEQYLIVSGGLVQYFREMLKDIILFVVQLTVYGALFCEESERWLVD